VDIRPWIIAVLLGMPAFVYSSNTFPARSSVPTVLVQPIRSKLYAMATINKDGLIYR